MNKVHKPQCTVNQQILAAIKFGVSQNIVIYVNLAAIKFGVSLQPVYVVYDRRICWRRQILAKTRNSPNSPNIIARQNLLIYSILSGEHNLKAFKIFPLSWNILLLVYSSNKTWITTKFLSAFVLLVLNKHGKFDVDTLQRKKEKEKQGRKRG